jgi:hypothetical protein
MLFREKVAIYCENHMEHKRKIQFLPLRYKVQPVNAV